MQKIIETDSLILKTPHLKEAPHLQELQSESQMGRETLLGPSHRLYSEQLKKWIKEFREEKSVRFFIFTRVEPQRFVGLCHFTPRKENSIGTWLMEYEMISTYENHERIEQIIVEALSSALDYVFHAFKVHCIQAPYLPTNQHTAKALIGMGFESEGDAKKYVGSTQRREEGILMSLRQEKWLSHRFLTASLVRELEQYLHSHIPLSAAMGIKVVQASRENVILNVSFLRNINHQKTVFGGSLHAAATLACWSLLHLNLKEQGPHILISKSQIDYHFPVDADFHVSCAFPDQKNWLRFLQMLEAKKKARIELTADIFHDKRRCVSYKGVFAAIIEK